jgi:hypothetical protein
MGSVNLERMGQYSTGRILPSIMISWGETCAGVSGGLQIARHYSTELSRLAYLQSGGAEALR